MTYPKEVCENGVIINIENTVQTPKKNEVVFNQEMSINSQKCSMCLNLIWEGDATKKCLLHRKGISRSTLSWNPVGCRECKKMEAASTAVENALALAVTKAVCQWIDNRSLAIVALSAYIESGWCLNKTIRCLDGFGATGVAGLSWAKAFPDVEVTINDPVERACNYINKNKQINNLNVEVSQQDVNILLHQRPFDFMYLDCYGSSVPYLDAIFKNVPKNSVLVITSTDDAALYGKAPDVTLRNYGGFIMKTFYAKELAARLIIASIIRSAAKCNKGIEVLSCIAVKSHINVIVKVTRGPAAATQCVHKIQKIIHCCLCEDRAFHTQSIHPLEHPYACLSCECRSRSSGQVAVELGPVWTDSIFDSSFCAQMLHHSTKLEQSHKITTLLQTILTESLGGTSTDEFKNAAIPETSKNQEVNPGEEPVMEEVMSAKRLKLDNSVLCSPFYFNLHRHSPKGYDLGKLNKVVSFIQSSGHRASRTHFDPEAVRTSASLKEFNQLLILFSTGTNQ